MVELQDEENNFYAENPIHRLLSLFDWHWDYRPTNVNEL